jgi:hypothetical protein
VNRFGRYCLLLLFAFLPPQSEVWAQAVGCPPRCPPGQNDVRLAVVAPLDHGELTMPMPDAPGYYEIAADTGVETASNAVQLGVTSRGTLEISGEANTNIFLIIDQEGFLCDPSYLDPCVGVPELELSHTFTGTIPPNNCQAQRCTEIIYIGGRFSFGGGAEGRWDNTLVITANYE